MDMESLGERLQYALKRKGISQSELARQTGIRPQTVQALCSGKNQKTRFLHEIAKALELNIDWLATGIGSIEPENSDDLLHLPTPKRIPLLTYQELISSYSLHSITNYIYTVINLSRNGFAFKVENDSMDNPFASISIPKNSIIIVDPEIKAENHSLVIALIKNETTTALFRQYITEGNTQYLKALNPQYPLLQLKKNDTIKGVVLKAEINIPHFL